MNEGQVKILIFAKTAAFQQKVVFCEKFTLIRESHVKISSRSV